MHERDQQGASKPVTAVAAVMFGCLATGASGTPASTTSMIRGDSADDGGTRAVFTGQRVITTEADSAHSVYAADLDEDGDVDVLSASYRDDKIAWYENLGDGVFSEQRVVSTEAVGALWVRTADLDGDGDPDVLSASSVTVYDPRSRTHQRHGKIAWYENRGDGDFSDQRIITTDGADALHVADLDSDGHIDVLSAYGQWIEWYQNRGDGDFRYMGAITSEAHGAFSLHAADVDGDGEPDVLSASWKDDKIAWYENLGGAFSEQRVITTDADGAVSVHAADVDGDGDVDVLSASSYDDKIAWHENLGDGLFSEQRVITTDAGNAQSVHAADLDGDGDPDVLSASWEDANIAWYENLGDGAFSEQRILTTRAVDAQSVYAGDLDGDGDTDVLSASVGDDKIAWHENLGAGLFAEQQGVAADASLAQSVYAADLDGDGDPDVLSASAADDKIAWHESLGGGSFSEQRVITTDADGAQSVHAADLDGDGDADVLSASWEDDTVAWHENLGGGEFSAQRVITTDASNAASVHAADLDGDGDADVLFASAGDDTVAWHENLGGGAFSEQRVITDKANGAWSVHAADLDGDGDPDVLSAAEFDDEIAWHENLGGGEFSEQLVITAEADGARSVFAADLDDDGDPDVLSASYRDGKIAWHENLGGGDFSGQRVITIEADGARSVHAADFDGDGDPDVISASWNNNTIGWHENLGADEDLGHVVFSVFQAISYQAHDVTSVYAADVDGDGDLDVLSASEADHGIAWYENRSDRRKKTAPTASPTDVRVVAGVRRLTVSWESIPAASNGGAPILRHVALADPRNGAPPSRCKALAGGESCVIEGLVPDVVEYEVRVRADNAFGPGPLSKPVLATPGGSHRLVGEDAGDGAGWSVASADGGDVILGSPFHSSDGRHAAGAVYLVAAADFAAADDADALDDGLIGLVNAAGQDASWKLVGESAGDAAGWNVAAANGHDGGNATRAYAAVGAPRANSGAGVVYLVAGGDLAAADAADGDEDGVVDLGNVAARDGSWKIGGGAGDRLGATVASAGDVDGDGHAELLVHGAAERRGAGFGAAFVLSLDDADLAAADEADGAADGVIESRTLAARANFWEFFGVSLGSRVGTALAAVGDADGDGRDDLLLGAPHGTIAGAAFLAGGADFPAGADGAVDTQNLAALPASYGFLGEAPFDRAGAAVASAGDINGDGWADLLVGAPGHSGRVGFAGGAAYLINASSLAAADAADSNADGTVNLANVAAQPGSWKFVGGRSFEGAGAGLSTSGDLDGDGVADLLVGADAGGAYLVAFSDLLAMDAADGSEDGVIDLGNAAAQESSWRIAGRGQVVGRDLRLSPVGDVDSDGSPDLLLAAGGAVWLLAVSDLPVALANFDAADGTTDGVVDFAILAERIGAPRGGGAVLGSVELHQGPLARTWNPRSGAHAIHAPPILGRRAAMVARVVHSAPAAPELSVTVYDASGAPLADRLRPLLDAETTPPDGPGDRWETAHVLDLPGELHRAGHRVRFEIDGEDGGGAAIAFDGLTVPRFDIAFVPIRSAAGEPPRIDADAYMAPVLDLLPVAEHRARAGATLDYRGGAWSAREAAFELLHRWNAEAADGEFFHGVFVHPGDGSACGHAFRGGPVAVSAAPGGACPSGAAVRGVGANLSLRPAPGCGAAYTDPHFPYPLGGIGPRRGWLFGAGRFVGPNDGYSDFMSDCGPAFVSDYHYRRAAEFLSTRMTTPDHQAPTQGRSLALTGGMDAIGEWSLHRVSVSRLPARAPRPDGSLFLALLDASGRELHAEPLAVYAESGRRGGGWAARVPLSDDRAHHVVVRARDGQVLFEERVGLRSSAAAIPGRSGR